MTHSSSHLEQCFLLRIVDLYSINNAYAISVYGNFKQNVPYLVLLLYTEIMMSHTFYFHFHLFSKSFFSFFFIWSACSLKMCSRKDASPNYFEFSKNQTRIGRYVWFQKSYKWKFYFESCFQLQKINNLEQCDKSKEVYRSEKQGEALSAIRKTIIHDAENLGLVPIYEAKSGEKSTMDQELDICNRVYKIATYNMRRVCVTIKKYNVGKPPYIQIRLFTAKENEAMKQVAYVNYILNEFKELSQILGGFMFVDNCKPQ